MKKKIKKWIRPSGKWTDIFVIAVVLSVAVMIGGDFFSLLLYKLFPVESIVGLITPSDGVVQFMLEYFWFIGIWIVFFLVCGIFRWNRPLLKQLAPNRNGNNRKGLLFGLLLGFGTNGFCILASVLMGDIHLYFHEFNPLLFFTFLFVVAIQSGAEEVMERVYLYQKLRRRYRRPVVAIVGNAAAFTAMHLLNPGLNVSSVLNILVIGLVFSLLVYYYDSVWAAIMYHTAWNFTQNIVFGLPNSGMVSEYSLFKLEAASAENGLFYNVDFGVEGSIGALLIETLVLAAIILLNRGKPEKHDVWAEAEGEPKEQSSVSQEENAPQ